MQIYILTDNENEISLFQEIAGNFIHLSEPLVDLLSNSDLILINANLGKNERTERLGLQWLQKLRRDYRILVPIIIYSFESYETLVKEYSILGTTGVNFIRLPFFPRKLRASIQGQLPSPITEEDLVEVIRWHCGLQNEWRLISHKIGNALHDYESHFEKIQHLVAEWKKSITDFAPDQAQNFANLVNSLGGFVEEINEGKVSLALQVLSRGLQKPTSQQNIKTSGVLAGKVHKSAPMHHSRILIADDEDRSSLIASLRHDHRYEVIEQARTLEQARMLLEAESPQVVLADWHFPEREDGLAFIKYALQRKSPPLVLITSKADLWDKELIEAGLPKSVINCSGPYDSFNATTIHGRIWLGANRNNIFIPVTLQPSLVALTLDQICLERLERYARIINSHVNRWHSFGRTLHYTLNQAYQILHISTENDVEIIQRIIKILESHKSNQDFSLKAIASMVGEVEKIHEIARRPPESEVRNLLRALLHGGIEQFASMLGEIDNIFDQLIEVADELQFLPTYEAMALEIHKSIEICGRDNLTIDNYVDLNNALNKVVASFPVLARELVKRDLDVGGEKQVRLIVAEDDLHWQNIIREAIAEVKIRLIDSATIIEDLYFDNAATAFAAVPKPRKEREIVGSLRDEKTILIADICLPKDYLHAKAINSAIAGKFEGLAIPHRENGLKLIRNVREYAYNVPVIVLSTIDSIDDRIAVGNWGIPDINYISKGVDDYRSIVQALIRLIEKSSKHQLEKIETEEQIQFRIDDIEIKFTAEEKYVFDAFFVVSQRNEEVRRKKKQRYNSGVTIAEIIEELALFNAKENRIKVEKTFNDIREQILESFRRMRRYISTHEIIKSIRRSDGDFAYQIVAAIPTIEEQYAYFDADGELSLSQEHKICRILVVDSNPQNMKEISELLTKLDYEIETVTNVEDAIKAAERFLPNILCIDMNLPMTLADYKWKPVRLINEGGLVAIEQIRAFLHDVRVIVPTMKYKESRLLARAFQMGVSAYDFIDKGRVNWLAWLAAVIGKKRREMLFNEVTDLRAGVELPLVEIIEGSDLDKGILKLLVNGRLFETRPPRRVKNNRDEDAVNRILGILLRHPNEWIAESQIENLIGKEATIVMWKNWRRRLRQIIREWLGIIKADFNKSTDPSYLILESREAHLNLHVTVIAN